MYFSIKPHDQVSRSARIAQCQREAQRERERERERDRKGEREHHQAFNKWWCHNQSFISIRVVISLVINKNNAVQIDEF